ncbi:MAG: O-antigen ligase family protein [Planctomycetes bacterium]|nr:O-antigen ligase family protein [Planctomycetota bacterium]
MLFKHPEITFALFLNAGAFKSDPRLASILPGFFDLTIFFGLIAGLSILLNVVKNKLKIPHISSTFFIPYSFLVLLMLASLLYTEAPIYGKDKFLRFITIGTLSAFGPIFLFKERKRLYNFFCVFIAISTLMVIVSTISASFTSSGFHMAFGSNWLALGRMAGTASLIILFCFLLPRKTKGRKNIWTILFLLNTFGLFYTGGRGPVIAFVITLLLLAILTLLSLLIKRSKNDTRILKTTSLVTVMIFLVILIFPQPFGTLINRVRVALTEPRGGSSISLRLNSYGSAIKAISQHPLLGVGIGGFSVYHSGIDQLSYPHNIFLEIWCELGVLGIIVFIFLITLCIFSLFKLKDKYRDEKQYLLITTILTVFVFAFINTLFSGDINNNRLFFTWFGIAYALRNIFKSENYLLQMHKNFKKHENKT